MNRTGPDEPESASHRDLLDHLLEGCQVLGFDWRYRYLNPAAQTHNRRPNAELIGHRYQDMWPGIEATEVYARIRDCLESRAPQAMENEFTFPDGHVGWFELRITPVPEGVFIMSLDISDRKRMESDLRRSTEQLVQAQKLESVGRLAGGVAHDFNNLLSVIMGHAEMALEDARDDADMQAHLRMIGQAARRSAEVTQQLLAFARRQTIEPRLIDINGEVEINLGLLRRLFGEDIELEWHPEPGLMPVLMDPTQLHQVLTNLCLNARDAITGVGRITVETRNISLDAAACAGRPGFHPGEFVVLTVSDNGAGMEREVAARVFEPFFTTKELGHGTGLGLATVYGIVKQNDGFINVYSEPGRGTTFRIYLTGVPAAHADERLAPDRAVTDWRGTETILVVEDEALILAVTAGMLERSGYRVLAAGSPEDALALVRDCDDRIDLLLSDVIMPGMTGPALAELVRASCPDLKVIYTSGYTANVIAHRGVVDPGVNFLPKPFTRRQLSEKVRRVLDGLEP
jgi:two-component system, cell cycle sensor histidine kinase and response regulator CckA